MAVGERDPATGRETTGHEWNGIRELDTPVPRGILLFLIVTHVWAVVWWFLVPAWPIGVTYTKGLLGIEQKQIVEERLAEAREQRASWENRIVDESYDAILADESLMQHVDAMGDRLFGDNCAACHGRDGSGGRYYPDLTDDDWLWGTNEPEMIEQTLRVGINSQHPEARLAQMPAFGQDGILEREQVHAVSAYVYSLSNPDYTTPENVDRIAAGEEVFATTCAACHGEDAAGNPQIGAPDLTDDVWLYGGEIDSIIASIHGGRQGHMPTWDERLSDVQIRTLALYVHSMQAGKP